MSRSVTKISAKIYVLRAEEGGRKTPLFTGYRPAVYFGDRQTDGLIIFNCQEKPALGGEYTVTISLAHPEYLGDTLKKDATFDFREGPHIIGRGKVLSLDDTNGESHAAAPCSGSPAAAQRADGSGPDCSA
jgi:elongation factor Tu